MIMTFDESEFRNLHNLIAEVRKMLTIYIKKITLRIVLNVWFFINAKR